VDDEPRSPGRYSFADWRADGFRGPPPWRRGWRPAYLAISIVLVAALVTIFVLAASRR